MGKETKINYIGAAPPKAAQAAKRARDCLKGYYHLSNLATDLSRQIYGGGETLYLNPTEKMLISKFVSKGDSFATVSGSGDFAIEAGRAGAEQILTFDINPNQYFPAALKLAALQNMSYDEFWGFFSEVQTQNWLSKDSYDQLKKRAQKDPALYAFFDEVMRIKDQEYRKMVQYVRNNPLLNLGMNPEEYPINKLNAMLSQMPDYTPSTVIRTIHGMIARKDQNTYLENAQAYEEARRAISNCKVGFVKANLTSLRDTLRNSGIDNDRFNAMYLSNVPQFIDGELFGKTVSEQLMPMLDDNGCIVYCCQGTSIEYLNTPVERLDRLRSALAKATPNFENLIPQQLCNSIGGYNALREKCDIELWEEPTLDDENGDCLVDTYVRVSRRRK